MKGISLSISFIVILSVSIIVLVIVVSMLASSSNVNISRVDANKIFSSKCSLYKGAGCAWSVTYSPDFKEFSAACKILYGNEMNDYTCLKGICCQECTTDECRCKAQCAGCAAMPQNLRQNCCSNYQNLYGCTQSCSVC